MHSDDIEKLNEAVRPFDLEANRDPSAARRTGRYVLENDEHIDVLVSDARTTVDSLLVRFAARPKDAEDIRLLERLKEARDE